MNILPKFLYLFQCLPLPPPAYFFSKMTKIFRNFIWNNRWARLRLSLLYLLYDRGGLKLSNFKWYYWASRLWTTSFGFKSTSFLSWEYIERETSSSHLPLYLYLYSGDLVKLQTSTDNPFVSNTICVWYEVHKYLNVYPKMSQFTPIWGNSNFPLGEKD